jgi:hypothetical protein
MIRVRKIRVHPPCQRPPAMLAPVAAGRGRWWLKIGLGRTKTSRHGLEMGVLSVTHLLIYSLSFVVKSVAGSFSLSLAIVFSLTFKPRNQTHFSDRSFGR